MQGGQSHPSCQTPSTVYNELYPGWSGSKSHYSKLGPVHVPQITPPNPAITTGPSPSLGFAVRLRFMSHGIGSLMLDITVSQAQFLSPLR